MKTTKRQLKNLIKEEVLTLLEGPQDRQALTTTTRGETGSSRAQALSGISQQEVQLIQLLRKMEQTVTGTTGNQANTTVLRYIQMASDEIDKAAGVDPTGAGDQTGAPATAGAPATPEAAAAEEVMVTTESLQEDELVGKIIQRLSQRSR